MAIFFVRGGLASVGGNGGRALVGPLGARGLHMAATAPARRQLFSDASVAPHIPLSGLCAAARFNISATFPYSREQQLAGTTPRRSWRSLAPPLFGTGFASWHSCRAHFGALPGPLRTIPGPGVAQAYRAGLFACPRVFLLQVLGFVNARIPMQCLRNERVVP